MNVGFIVGKFYPPHKGHHHLIDTALAECDRVFVLVAYSSVESIDFRKRVQWLREMHPLANILAIEDNVKVDYDDDEVWEQHVALFSTAISGHERANLSPVNRFYSSELWGAQMAEMLSGRDGRGNVAHHMVDVNRLTVPVSASKVRADVPGMWEYLSDPVRADLVKRVVICGGESTGTTTLAKALANELKTVCVPEYGRHFDWAVGKHHQWASDDFLHIAHTQVQWERNLAKYSGPIMICDTDTFATEMFHEIYLGIPATTTLVDITEDRTEENPAALYIITSDEGVEFEDDGTRFNSGKRSWSTHWLQEYSPGPTTITVEGTPEERLAQAMKAVKDIRWTFAKPLEYA